MTTESDSLFERRFTNQLPELLRVADEAVSFLEHRGVGPKAVNVAHLTIEEVATNILKYGYDDTAAHDILLRMQIEPGKVLIVVEDDGHEFNPIDAPPPDFHSPIEEREPGGLGIHLVRKLAAQMDYQRSDGRNRLSITIAS
jgi:anti-sigma regulatory factor (Ser/Thr protein kinase)